VRPEYRPGGRDFGRVAGIPASGRVAIKSFSSLRAGPQLALQRNTNKARRSRARSRRGEPTQGNARVSALVQVSPCRRSQPLARLLLDRPPSLSCWSDAQGPAATGSARRSDTAVGPGFLCGLRRSPSVPLGRARQGLEPVPTCGTPRRLEPVPMCGTPRRLEPVPRCGTPRRLEPVPISEPDDRPEGAVRQSRSASRVRRHAAGRRAARHRVERELDASPPDLNEESWVPSG
jgi:hypothetical protein